MTGALVLHIPHSSTEIPPDVRDGILLDDAELARETLTLTDLHTDELFGLGKDSCRVRNEWSRLVFDPERFRDDHDEPMAEFGMGAIYVRTVDGKPLRELSAGAREEMLARFYDPYHARLTEEVTRMLDRQDRCLLVDCHSFPSRALPFETDKVSARPDICIGTCDFHTPEGLARRIEKLCAARGMSTRRNWPFAGALTPMRYYRRDPRVRSIMIEVNRRLYMDEASGARSIDFDATRRFVRELLVALEAAA